MGEGHTLHSVHGEVRGQGHEVCSLPPLHRFQGWHSAHQTCTSRTLLSHLINPEMIFCKTFFLLMYVQTHVCATYVCMYAHVSADAHAWMCECIQRPESTSVAFLNHFLPFLRISYWIRSWSLWPVSIHLSPVQPVLMPQMQALVPCFYGGSRVLNSSSYMWAGILPAEPFPNLPSDRSFCMTFQRNRIIKKEVFVVTLLYSLVEFYWKLTQIQEEEVLQPLMLRGRHPTL